MTDPIRSSTTPRTLDFDPPSPASGVNLAPKVGDVGVGASIDSMKELQAPPATYAADALKRFVLAQTTPVPAYTATAQTAAIQAKLNELMKTATPAYRLPDGTTVNVPAFFRMGGPDANESSKAPVNRGPRDAIAAKIGAIAPYDSGRVSLASIRKMTQGLIDAGRLPPGSDPGESVRQMAWDHAVGIDCAGYVQTALFASHGGNATKYGLQGIQNENLMSLATNAKWGKVALTQARPGDVLTLEKNANDVGHAAIVYEHVLASPAQRDVLRAQMKESSSADPRIAAVLGDPKLHVFQLDSSWGTGTEVRPGGGVQRRTWLFGEGTGWVSDDAVHTYRSDGFTPRGHPLGGTFRPKGEP